MNGENEIMVTQNQVAVKDSETEIIQRIALGLLKEVELSVEKEKYEKYLGYVKKFATKKLKMSESEIGALSADQIRAIDFLMVPKAKRVMKIWGLANLAFISAISAAAIFADIGFLYLLCALVVHYPLIRCNTYYNTYDERVGTELDFLRKRRTALEYLKKKEAEDAQIKTED